MSSLMYEMFADIMADKIITFLEHPTARMLKGRLECKVLLKFDPEKIGENGRPYTGLHMLEIMIGITSPTAVVQRAGSWKAMATAGSLGIGVGMKGYNIQEYPMH